MSGPVALMQAESIVIAPALANDGARCVRVLLVSEDGSRMAADLRPEQARQMAAIAQSAADGPGLTQAIIHTEL